MQAMHYWFGILVFIVNCLQQDHAFATDYRSNCMVPSINVATQAQSIVCKILHCISTATADTTGNEQSPPSFEDIIKKDINKEGAISNVLSGLALCYNALANILLYSHIFFSLVNPIHRRHDFGYHLG